ncbi:MAG: hypothetical protein ACI9SB_002555 [Candidatus Azotimanducaceae bacterium]|jgi:hypothetical protein
MTKVGSQVSTQLDQPQLGTYQMNPKQQFTHRVAQITDIPCIIKLMQLSIAENMKAFLTTAEIEAANLPRSRLHRTQPRDPDGRQRCRQSGHHDA